MAKVKTKKCRPSEQVKEVVQNNQLQVAYHFPCPIYLIERPDFIKDVNEVSEEKLEEQKKLQTLNEIYPVIMTPNLFGDERINKFCEFVGGTAWNILNEQGYAMNNLVTSFTEIWTQEHHKHSAMEQHVHGRGIQIVGFYFLDVPEGSSRVLFHDPRAGKIHSDLQTSESLLATVASQVINFEPKPGLMIFTNSWVAHSFTRHAADKPLKFVHFNLTVNMAPQTVCVTTPPAEII